MIVAYLTDKGRSMPDRDFFPKLPHRGWGAACRLFASQGDTPAATKAAERALASSLRRDQRLPSSRAEFEKYARRRLSEGLLGPSRVAALREASFAEVARREDAVLRGLAPAIGHFFDQVVAGHLIKAPSHRRITPTETLVIPIPTIARRDTVN